MTSLGLRPVVCLGHAGPKARIPHEARRNAGPACPHGAGAPGFRFAASGLRDRANDRLFVSECLVISQQRIDFIVARRKCDCGGGGAGCEQGLHAIG